MTAFLLACASCFGSADSDQVKSAKIGVLVLLGFAAAAALVFYGLWFLRKLKDVSST